MSPYVTPQTLAADFDGDGTVGFPSVLLLKNPGSPDSLLSAREGIQVMSDG